jgi:hypothetical protein
MMQPAITAGTGLFLKFVVYLSIITKGHVRGVGPKIFLRKKIAKIIPIAF